MTSPHPRGKLFVIGTSGAGKTPVARMVAEQLGVPHVAASAWVRRAFPPTPGDAGARAGQVEAMTRFAVEELRRDPFVCLRSLEGQLDGPCVVEGVRNPFDFVHAFDPRTDRVLFLSRADNALPPTAFERGIDVIRAYVAWLDGAGLLSRLERVREVEMRDVSEIERVVDETAAWAALARLQESASGRAARQRVHADITPMRVFVDKPLLYGGDARFAGDVVPCTAFAFSSYPGSAPTFKVLLDDGAVFSFVAASALRTRPVIDAPVLDLADLTYHACPDGDVVVHTFALLAEGDVLCFFKKRDLWVKGKYLFTVDWYRGNDLLHCVALENGQIAMLPHHKIKFAAGRTDLEPGFAPYKKLRNEWKLAPPES